MHDVLPEGIAGRRHPIPAAATLRETSDFSPVAARYDATRDLPPALLNAAYDRFALAGLLPRGARILDAGCGTGQISLPLAARGHAVEGYDVSPDMVRLAQAKAAPGWRAVYRTADVRGLPVADAGFDVVIASKLFQHVPDWPAAIRELLRALKPGGAFIHLAERGAFSNPVRRYFAAMADGMGFTDRFPGMQRRGDLVDRLAASGAVAVEVDLADLAWRKTVRYGDAWDQLRERLFAEFWCLPDAAYEQILADTADWIEAQPDGRDTIVEIRPCLSADLFRKPAASEDRSI